MSSRSQVPSCSHGIQDSVNTCEVKLDPRFLPDPLCHRLALGRVQEGSESARGFSERPEGLERLGMKLRMDLPTHEEPPL
jgi:hypothetical protein